MSNFCTSCGKESDYGHIKGQCRECFAKAHSAKEVRIRDNQDRLFEYLDDKTCVDCGIDLSNVLTFDHVRGKKKANVTDMVSWGYSWETILKEIGKCEIRCFNCHMLKTANERSTWRSYKST